MGDVSEVKRILSLLSLAAGQFVEDISEILKISIETNSERSLLAHTDDTTFVFLENISLQSKYHNNAMVIKIKKHILFLFIHAYAK